MPRTWWPAAKGKGAVRNCNYLLAALLHQNNPDVIQDPSDAPSGDTRESIRKKVYEAKEVSVKESKSGPKSERGKHEEAMMAAKASMMQKNVELQECKVVKEQLMMLKEFKESFVSGSSKDGDDGEKDYDDTVLQMLHQLPIMKKQRATNGDRDK
jgi:hypothetical protein